MAFIATQDHLPIIRRTSHRGTPPIPPVDPVVDPKVTPETRTCRTKYWYHTIAGVTHVHVVNPCHWKRRAINVLVPGRGGVAQTRRVYIPETPLTDQAYRVYEMDRMVD